MAPSYTYQKVRDDDIHEEVEVDGDGSTPRRVQHDAASRDFSERAWFNRPSVGSRNHPLSFCLLMMLQVFWLLPVFLLFNLGMGATTMPKMNVLTSLLCRQILEADPASMQHEPRHDVSMMPSKEGMGQNHIASAVIIGEHNPQCSIDRVESATSMLMLYGNLIAGIIGAVTAPFWGKLSDRYGRIRPLAVTSTIILASETIFVLVAKLPDSLSLNWIYLAYLLEGLRCVALKSDIPRS